MVPGMTWVAIDPTNRQWVNDRYVAVSFGRDARDATPLRGTFKGAGGQTMKVNVKMKRRAPEKAQKGDNGSNDGAYCERLPEGKRAGMNIHISYQTQYTYDREVSFSPHIFRLFPRGDHFFRVKQTSFQTNMAADMQHRRDLFDNEIARCYYPGKSRILQASLSLDLEVREKNAFHFLLDRHALDFPFAYTAGEAAALAPFIARQGPMTEMPFWKIPSEPQPTVTALVELNEALFKNLKYERRDEGAARSPMETVAVGSGACRDFAVLLADVLRSRGVAVRLASGYLCEFGEEEKRAEGALHAWVEAYLPGAGWLGLDPTNGVFCNHNHITAAIGLTPGDVTPVDGSYYDKGRVPSLMSANLLLSRCDE